MTTVLEPITIPRAAGRPRGMLAALLCALLGFATYACSLQGTYVLDDHSVIRADPRITAGQWKSLWTQGYRVDGYDKLYRPLVSTSYALQWRLHGDRPWAFHLVNLILHAAVTGVFAMLALRMLGELPGLVAGLLFAVLPIHTEVVVNIVGRAECLCALPMLYGLYLFLTRPLTGRLMVALCVCFLVAALSKEQGILFPLLLLAAAPLRSTQGLPRSSPTTRKLFVAMFLWLPAGYLVFRESMVPMWWDRSVMYWDANPIIRAQGWNRLWLPIAIFGRYVQLTLAPLKLSYDYSGLVIGWRVSPTDPRLYLGALSVLLFVAAGVWSIAKRRWAVFLAVSGLALTYALVSNAGVLIGVILGERLFYLPSAFLLLLISGPISRLPARILLGAMMVAVPLLGARSVSYAVRWNDDISFVLWSLREQPRGAWVYGFAYTEYAARRDWESALRVAEQFRATMPDSVNANYMCIRADMALGRFADAKRAAEFGEAQPILEMDKLPMKRMWTEADETLKEQQHSATAPSTRPGQ